MLGGVFGPVQPLVKFGQQGDGGRPDILLLQRPPIKALGHRMVANISSHAAGIGQYVRFVRGHSNRPFKIIFRLGKLVTQTIVHAQ